MHTCDNMHAHTCDNTMHAHTCQNKMHAHTCQNKMHAHKRENNTHSHTSENSMQTKVGAARSAFGAPQALAHLRHIEHVARATNAVRSHRRRELIHTQTLTPVSDHRHVSQGLMAGSAGGGGCVRGEWVSWWGVRACVSDSMPRARSYGKPQVPLATRLPPSFALAGY